MFSGIYQGCKVLVTGHTGFKGSWLVFWLNQLGAEVCGYSLAAPTTPSHWDLLNLDHRSEIEDIRNVEQLERVFEEFQPEVVFHLAAQPLVRSSYTNPVETYSTNVMGALHVFEACRKTDSVRAVINVTSDKCYENKEWVWGYRENDPMGGHDPYSSSKGCSELLTASYRKSYFNPAEYGSSHQTLLASCRAGNVIGGGDWAEDRLIPDMMRSIDLNEAVAIRNPSATRPWQHVLEPLGGYLLVGQKLLEGHVDCASGWNFGPADESTITVGEVASHIKTHWNKINYTLGSPVEGPHEANLLKLDCSKSYALLGWNPVWNSAETFKRTVDWYREFYENKCVLTPSDLSAYMNEFNVGDTTHG